MARAWKRLQAKKQSRIRIPDLVSSGQSSSRVEILDLKSDDQIDFLKQAGAGISGRRKATENDFRWLESFEWKQFLKLPGAIYKKFDQLFCQAN